MNQWEQLLRIMQHPWAQHSTEQIQVQQFLLRGHRSTVHTQQQMCTASCRATTITQVVQSRLQSLKTERKELPQFQQVLAHLVTWQTQACQETTRLRIPSPVLTEQRPTHSPSLHLHNRWPVLDLSDKHQMWLWLSTVPPVWDTTIHPLRTRWAKQCAQLLASQMAL